MGTSTPLDHSERYSESFSVQPGHCFRLITRSVSGNQQSPARSDVPVEYQGRFKHRAGKWHQVESCMDHAGDLTDGKRISASVTDIRDAPSSPFRD